MRRVERASAARLPVGEDGIIPGAGAIELPVDGARAGVLLVHGFGDTTQTLGYLAHHLHARGYGVEAPLLPGHGRTLREFMASREGEWIGAAREALHDLRGRYERVAVVGLSMGGALATLLAAESADLSALILIAPYLNAPAALRWVARYYPLFELTNPVITGHNTRSILDPEESDLSRAYRATTPRLVHDLVAVADRARAALPRISAPTLIVQSRQDNRISPAVAERAFAALGMREKRLEWVAGGGHIITVDYGRERVFEVAAEWLDAYLRLPPGAQPTRLRGA